MRPEEINRLQELSRFETQYYEQGMRYIAGIDEAGRGPWAGPVTAAAVILPPGFQLEGVDDSKKLSARKRQALAPQIKAGAIDWAVVSISPQYIDRHDILLATKAAMRAAVEALKPLPDFLLIDAVQLDDINSKQRALIRGDQLSISIACASILAKVTRDEALENYEQLYPGYGFAQHKGYGTKAHQENLLRLGACPIHRKSFKPVGASVLNSER
jgi:ribonuclease HII